MAADGLAADPDGALQREVERFLYREAGLLDDGRFRDWLELFTDDAVYWMPARETRDDASGVAGPGEMALFEDDKAFLLARIERLESGFAHAETPPSRTRHFVSNIEIVEARPGELVVRSNILVFQSRLERTENFYVGCREDRLRRAADGWRIARRKITLDQTLLPRTLSVLF